MTAYGPCGAARVAKNATVRQPVSIGESYMNGSFKRRLRLDILDDRTLPSSLGLSSPDVIPPPPPEEGADTFVSQSVDPAAGSTVIVCDPLKVKGQRST